MEAEDAIRVSVEADTGGIEKALGDLSSKANAMGAALTTAFRGAAGGGKSLDGVLRQLGMRISAIALDAALKPVGNLAGGLFGQIFGGLGGAFGGSAPAQGAVVPFAKGGVVRAPSFFPSGGQIGLMGEAGAEAILPLRRGADGTLGVAAPGGGARGGGASIVFNVQTPNAESFKRAEVQIQAMLARAAMRGQRGL